MGLTSHLCFSKHKEPGFVIILSWYNFSVIEIKEKTLPLYLLKTVPALNEAS